MRLPEEQEERGPGARVIYTIVAVSAFVLIIMLAVLLSNTDKGKNSNAGAKKAIQPSPSPVAEEKDIAFAEGQKDIEALYKEHKLRAEDLDFWDMYKGKGTVIVEPEPTPSPDPLATPTPSPEPTEEDLAADGLHTQVTYADGTSEWIEISQKIPANTYDFTKLKITNGKMAYYQDDEPVSKLGVELSESSGAVDFELLKAEGIDFVMLRLGSRGYESGLINEDTRFADNLQKALKEGLEVGVIFYSQAVNVKEAAEEAEFVLDKIRGQQVRYPVAFAVENIANDDARTDILNADKRTQVAEAFLQSIEAEGYRGLLYGSKNWLLTELVPDKLLVDYDVWLNDTASIPDYPYRFRLWKYASNQTLSSVEKPFSYVISFVDYVRK